MPERLPRTVATLLLALAALAATPARAQERYPARPVQVIIAFTAGGPVDVMGRSFLEVLGARMGTPFVVVNRDGAGGSIGFAALAAAKPDGYTLGFGPTSPITNSPHVMKKLPYGFGDFEFVCHVFDNVFTVAVLAESRFRSLRELIEHARANPGRLTYGHSGVTSLPHLSMEGLALEAGVKVTQIPYRGGAPMVTQLLGGQLDFAVTSLLTIVNHRNVRALAVFSERRLAFLPDVPTVAENGLPGMPPGYNGIYAPKGTPADVLAALERGCEAATASEAFRALAAKLYQPVVYLSRADFTRRAQADNEFKARLIRSLDLGQN